MHLGCGAGPTRRRVVRTTGEHAESLRGDLRDHRVAVRAVAWGHRPGAAHGHDSHIHTSNILDLSLDLPLVVEIIDDEDRVNAFLPVLDQMMETGTVTLERVRVLRYGPTRRVGDPQTFGVLKFGPRLHEAHRVPEDCLVDGRPGGVPRADGWPRRHGADRRGLHLRYQHPLRPAGTAEEETNAVLIKLNQIGTVTGHPESPTRR